jgi:hypothetical protein
MSQASIDLVHRICVKTRPRIPSGLNSGAWKSGAGSTARVQSPKGHRRLTAFLAVPADMITRRTPRNVQESRVRLPVAAAVEAVSGGLSTRCRDRTGTAQFRKRCLRVDPLRIVAYQKLHIFIDFGQLCSSKPATHVHGNRPAVFMISATRFQAGQHTCKAS